MRARRPPDPIGSCAAWLVSAKRATSDSRRTACPVCRERRLGFPHSSHRARACGSARGVRGSCRRGRGDDGRAGRNRRARIHLSSIAYCERAERYRRRSAILRRDACPLSPPASRRRASRDGQAGHIWHARVASAAVDGRCQHRLRPRPSVRGERSAHEISTLTRIRGLSRSIRTSEVLVDLPE